MSMSKRDYQAIARAIHGVELLRYYPVTRQDVIAALADVLAADSPRFDRARFVEACETGRCKGMPR